MSHNEMKYEDGRDCLMLLEMEIFFQNKVFHSWYAIYGYKIDFQRFWLTHFIKIFSAKKVMLSQREFSNKIAIFKSLHLFLILPPLLTFYFSSFSFPVKWPYTLREVLKHPVNFRNKPVKYISDTDSKNVSCSVLFRHYNKLNRKLSIKCEKCHKHLWRYSFVTSSCRFLFFKSFFPAFSRFFSGLVNFFGFIDVFVTKTTHNNDTISTPIRKHTHTRTFSLFLAFTFSYTSLYFYK